MLLQHGTFKSQSIDVWKSIKGQFRLFSPCSGFTPQYKGWNPELRVQCRDTHHNCCLFIVQVFKPYMTSTRTKASSSLDFLVTRYILRPPNLLHSNVILPSSSVWRARTGRWRCHYRILYAQPRGDLSFDEENRCQRRQHQRGLQIP